MKQTGNTRRRWLALVSVISILAVALNLLACRHARAMLFFTSSTERTQEPEKLTTAQKLKALLLGVNVPRPQGTKAPSALGASTVSRLIATSDHAKLGTWYHSGTNQTLVILFHGYSSEKTTMLTEAKALLGLGFSVLLVDFRGSGDSSEACTTIGYLEAEDVKAAFNYARSSLPETKIVLYGQSMGAAAVLKAIHDHHVRPDAVIVESVFDTLLHTVRHRFEAMHLPSFPAADLLVFWGGRQFAFNGFRHNPVDYACSVGCPTLFLHGAADPRALPSEARQVCANIRVEKEFIEFAGVGHESMASRAPAEWLKCVSRFLAPVAERHERP